ncbi:MAG: single-stranded-DNA-specific exonuclease RecJ [Chloroflexi bacterium]|nr:single-stranded-DNA-specific exonuclease RecJ [Chloroflexota bacterium]
MTNGEWRGRPAPPFGFANSLGLTPFQAHLLYSRGVRDRADADLFLTGDARLFHDPMSLPDMENAVERLARAVAEREKIAIFGDFDTDGITGTALLVHTLRDLGNTALPYIPDRTDEGHGLNKQAVESLAEQGVTVLITVDCGTTSFDEVAQANALGMDVIITDHHIVESELPAAHAIVNPQRPDSLYPFLGLTGAGLAFKLGQALLQHLGRPVPSRLMELAALGTVADVGPLIGENRVIVRLGLNSMKTTNEPGIAALANAAGLDLGSLNSEALSFNIIPRLNAAGRLGHASISLDLLTTQDDEQARRIANTLDRLNTERQKITERTMIEARRQVSEQDHGSDSVIIVGHQEWLPGILGLVAGRLSEEHNRPVVAMTQGDETSRASVRSVPGVDVHAALDEADVEFLRFGGHAQAAGFTIANGDVERLRQTLSDAIARQRNETDAEVVLEYDCEVPLSLLTKQTMAFIDSLAPHGAANPEPVFLSRNLRIMDARMVGAEGKHLKLRVGQNGSSITDAIAFRQGPRYALLPNQVDMLYSVGIDTWNGRSRMQLRVLDFRPSGAQPGS